MTQRDARKQEEWAARQIQNSKFETNSNRTESETSRKETGDVSPDGNERVQETEADGGAAGEDRLIHVLLYEVAGGAAPPDLTERILERARTRRRVVARRRWTVALAAAAVLVVAVLVTLFAGGPGYPEPTLTGAGAVVSGGRLERGATVTTGGDVARLALGGYCLVDIEAYSRLRIAGERKSERVMLEEGGVHCVVDRGRGRFCVESEAGTVSVTGTEFTVRLVEGGTGMVGKKMVVHVLAGAVLLAGAWGTIPLAAGEEGVAPAQGTIAAGKASYLPRAGEAWAEKGRIVGSVARAPAFKAEALDADGKVVVSREFAAGAKALELPFVAPGVYTLRVSAAGYATLDVKGLEVKAKSDLLVPVEFTAAGGAVVPPVTPPGAGAKIVAGTPTYLARDGAAWAEKGRIIGPVGNAPAFKVEAVDAQGNVALSQDFAAGARGMELQWLKPGVYTLKVTAEGYPALEVKSLEVKAGNDLRLAVEFTK